MKNIIWIITILFLCLALTSCDDDNPTVSCGEQVIIDANAYYTATTDQLTINSLEINADCLKINYGSSGCSGDSWILQLADSEAILESFPPQRNLVFSFENNELCEAFFTKELTFDITNLQVDGNQEVILNITNTDDEILYEY